MKQTEDSDSIILRKIMSELDISGWRVASRTIVAPANYANFTFN